MLEKMLIISRERVDKEDDGLWDSVFWMDDNCRPDLICREVNEIGKHLSSEDWDKIATDFRKQKRDHDI